MPLLVTGAPTSDHAACLLCRVVDLRISVNDSQGSRRDSEGCYSPGCTHRWKPAFHSCSASWPGRDGVSVQVINPW